LSPNQESAGGSDPASFTDFTVVPIVNRFGIGVEGSQTSGGLTAYARATLHMAAPTLDAHIDIHADRLESSRRR